LWISLCICVKKFVECVEKFVEWCYFFVDTVYNYVDMWVKKVANSVLLAT
jgi:hypothetical protein